MRSGAQVRNGLWGSYQSGFQVGVRAGRPLLVRTSGAPDERVADEKPAARRAPAVRNRKLL
ncbi:MAG: hypothetical protein WKG07_02265 [Hymenobacter sp.]